MTSVEKIVPTHLVICFGCRWDVDTLFKGGALLFQLYRFGPVVKGACDVDFLGRMVPVRILDQPRYTQGTAQAGVVDSHVSPARHEVEDVYMEHVMPRA